MDLQGVVGLWHRIDALSVDYQQQRPELELSDFTILVIRALLDYVVANVANVSNVANTKWEFTTSKINEQAKQIAEDSDGEYDPEKVNSQRVGQVFRKRRLEKPPRHRGQKERMWAITTAELVRWATAYSVSIPDEFKKYNPDLSLTIGDIGDIGNIGDRAVELVAGSELFEGVI